MPINVAIIVLINALVSYNPFSYFITLKVANKKIDSIKSTKSNKVVRDKVYKLLKTLSLS